MGLEQKKPEQLLGAQQQQKFLYLFPDPCQGEVKRRAALLAGV